MLSEILALGRLRLIPDKLNFIRFSLISSYGPTRVKRMTVDLKRATIKDLPVIHYNDGTTSITSPVTNDALDRLLTRLDLATNPLLMTDPKTGAPLRLTPEEAALIERMESGLSGTIDFDPFQPYVDFFTHERLDKPLCNRTEPKGRFMVSKWETERIKKLVYSIRKGYIKKSSDADGAGVNYDIWSTVDEEAEERARKRVHVPAPKPPLPGHAESYNPPEEYLFSPEEKAAYDALPEEERVRKLLPKRHRSLRLLPLYDRLVQERFSRCLDLYLCPRVVKEKIDIVDPDILLPELPSPDSLKPYPTTKSTEFVGHSGIVSAIDVHISGQWLASCSSDEVRVWDTITGRCVQVLEGGAQHVAWCPRQDVAILAYVTANTLNLFSPESCGLKSASNALIMGAGMGTMASLLKWRQSGDAVAIEHEHSIDKICWHNRGDYIACLMKQAPSLASSVMMHQLSRRTSQQPFGRLPTGQPRSIAFTNNKPYFLLATAQHIRVYDLMSQRLIKKLTPSAQGIGQVACHPSSPDNFIASVGDKLSWFDCDLSALPYKTLQTHTAAINSLAFHPSYPLFASGGNDGTLQVFYGKVFEELDKNALIVPVKVLRDIEGRQVHSVVFHPSQPWLYASDSSGTISVFV